MADASQQLFKRIVLHNRLLSESDVDRLLAEVPDPAAAIHHLVNSELLSSSTARQLQAMYDKKLLGLSTADQPDEGRSSPTADAETRSSHDARSIHDAPGSRNTPPIRSKSDARSPATQRSDTKSPDAGETEGDAGRAPSGAGSANRPRVTRQAAERARESPAARPESVGANDATDLEESQEAAIRVAPELERLAKLGGREFIEGLLLRTRELGASDLHIKAEMSPVLRRAGRLRDLALPAIDQQRCEVALLEMLDDEQRQTFLRTNDLDFSFDGGPRLGRFRASYLRQHRGVDAIFRPIPDQVPSFEELGLPPQVQRFTEYRVGIVLVTGPKGCGKTTTLAAMVDLINSQRREHIITVEDPIEFIHPCTKAHVNQRQVGSHTKSFSNALRSALREAPDVIMVGEMRDLETTSLAITAAETGHLVLATLHTPDALRTIGRVLDVFPPKEQPQIRAMISESLRGIVSQLLIPSTDGKSMELALEVLVNTPAIGHLIREERVYQIPGLMQTGRKSGMLLMDDSLFELATARRISQADALAHAHEPAVLEQRLAAASPASATHH